MKVRSVLFFIILCIPSISLAQHSEYVRSAISSVESVWVKPGAENRITLDYPFFEKMMGAYVEMPRFDYNQLPESVLKDFRNRVGRLDTIDEDALAELLQETVGQAILDILNDPEVMQNRGLAMRDEAAWQTFAATKARSAGLTVEELDVLMNSSYIYLPFIRSIRLSDTRGASGATGGTRLIQALTRTADSSDEESDYHSVHIDGGIIWFSVNVSPAGEVSISKLLAVSASARGRAEKGERHTFRFGNDSWELNSRDYALYEATQSWVRQLSVETQGIRDFQLRAGIVEVLSGRRYSLGIGRAEGVHLDDMYELVEVRMNPDGTESFKRVGFTRITRVGNNTEDPFNYSTATQLIGRRQGVGVTAREYPRIGYELRITAGFTQGLKIPAREFAWLQTDITETFELNLSYAYNLAPVTGTSQSFLSIDLGIGFPVGYEANPDFEDTAPLLGNIYFGYAKKYWFAGRNNIGLRFGAGVDALRFSSGSDNSLTLFAAGGRAGIDYEILLGPAFSLNIGAGYKYTTRPFWASQEIDGETTEFLIEDTDIYLGGLFYTAGFNYSIRNIGLNLFGFLDGLRDY